MSKLRLNNSEWVIVCDGRKALVLENVGDEKFPSLQTKEVHEHEDAKTHEQGSDAPGRSFQSVGTARSAVEQTDWHEQSEQAFLDALAGRLDAAVTAGETARLVVVAPPRALGILRQAYSPAVRKALHAEVDKDLVKLPVPEIEKYLTA